MAEVTTSPLRSSSPSPPPSAKKRKRQDAGVKELEVDITAPEPPSKKALRKAKKSKDAPINSQPKSEPEANRSITDFERPEASQPSKRSEYGVWIGNLPWSASKNDLRAFLTADTNITDDMITRIHMPAPKETTTPSRSFTKPQNKGFAYVDFSAPTALDEAIALSETLITGRRVLIKDSKSFEGRPQQPNEEQDIIKTHSGKPPSKRIFVGNLDFDATKESLNEHFARCGMVLDVHIATFEDSGKCKGYGWVEFDTIEAGQAAVRGWVDFHQEHEQSSGQGQSNKEEEKLRSIRKPKMRKWWVNKFQGRILRMEFAEAKEVRYKKRFGKSAGSPQQLPSVANVEPIGAADTFGDDDLSEQKPSTGRTTSQQVTKDPRPVVRANTGRLDARKVKPGAALAAAPRLQGSIVASKGKKTVLA